MVRFLYFGHTVRTRLSAVELDGSPELTTGARTTPLTIQPAEPKTTVGVLWGPVRLNFCFDTLLERRS